MGFCRRSLETTSLYPPVADTARWFPGSVPVSMPQRGWKLADTTVNLSAAIGRKSPAGGKKEAVGKSMPSETKEERTAGE